MSSPTKERSSAYKAGLAGFSFLTYAATLVLLYAGGFTTTIGAGMVFPDWPLSNGSLNPPGWTTDQAMMAEHGHRLLGATVGTLLIVLCVWMARAEGRVWLRRLSYVGLGLVIFQGLLGGLRVLLVNVDLAIVHGVTAQVFLCLLTAIAVAGGRWWFAVPARIDDAAERARWRGLRQAGTLLCALLIVQLVLGALMRHKGAGLAIPYFPHAAPTGSFLPTAWNWATGLHYAHRVLAGVIAIYLVVWVVRVWRTPGVTPAVRKLCAAALVLLCVQVALGAEIIWSVRAPLQTTLHVLNGAVLLSVCWAASFSFYREWIEGAVGRVAPRAA